MQKVTNLEKGRYQYRGAIMEINEREPSGRWGRWVCLRSFQKNATYFYRPRESTREGLMREIDKAIDEEAAYKARALELITLERQARKFQITGDTFDKLVSLSESMRVLDNVNPRIASDVLNTIINEIKLGAIK